MKIIDVTLRDGGFVCDFDWPMKIARAHFEVCGELGIDVVELGYWKQTAKSHNPFYNMNEDILAEIVDGKNIRSSVAVMIDYHYCSKQLNDYPRLGETRVEMIRITARREDLSAAQLFAGKLGQHTGLKVSLQIINLTGYATGDLSKVVDELIQDPYIDIIGFADSHGALNFAANYQNYTNIFEELCVNAQHWGMHLHNHTGRAVTNYWALVSSGCHYMDVSCRGLGKGAGNLPMEFVIRNEDLPTLLDYYSAFQDGPLRMSKREAFCLLAGRLSITDNYARLAVDLDMSAQDFYNVGKRLAGVEKDSFSKDSFEQIVKNILL